ncbi:hypothetical protein [Halobaculum sp. D14]
MGGLRGGGRRPGSDFGATGAIKGVLVLFAALGLLFVLFVVLG